MSGLVTMILEDFSYRQLLWAHRVAPFENPHAIGMTPRQDAGTRR